MLVKYHGNLEPVRAKNIMKASELTVTSAAKSQEIILLSVMVQEQMDGMEAIFRLEVILQNIAGIGLGINLRQKSNSTWTRATLKCAQQLS